MKKGKINIISLLKISFFLISGVFSAGLGLEGFLLPNGFIDGGVMGISLLITQLTHFHLSLLIVLINIPFIIAGYWHVSKKFGVTTTFAIVGLALCLWQIDFPVITHDKLLTSVFGGFFLGAGIGLCMWGGGVIDGTEILALIVSRKINFTIGNIILVINVIIFSAAAFLLNIEIALYSIITYLAASKTVDFIIQGIEEYTGVTVISNNPDEIRHAIIHYLNRGVTIYKGKRGFGKRGENTEDIDIIFCVVTRLEIPKLQLLIKQIDKNAFVIMQSINDTKGGMIKKRPLSH
ncbi:MAG: YitT family protein [Bacteroidota bacterium]